MIIRINLQFNFGLKFMITPSLILINSK